MTDPRILECAKAIYDAMDIADGLTPEAAETYARACILKWLEQEPSASTLEAGARSLDSAGWAPDHEGGILLPKAIQRESATKDATKVHTAMTAQARRELSE